MKKVENGKILMVRMDKLGDLVLTLPCDRIEALKGQVIHWWISQGTGFIPQHSQPPRPYTEWPKPYSWRNLIIAVQWLRREQISTAIVYYAPAWVGLALWLARVPVRVGRLSQWHSFLFFNRGVRQSRSQSQMHEADYNLDLVTRGLQLPLQNQIPPLDLEAPAHVDSPVTSDRYIVVHPGMAGSALNWPVEYYADLIQRLSAHLQVIVTGTVMDRPFIEPLQAKLGQNAKITWLNERLSPELLLAVLSRAEAVVAPSTGVLHLAASLGTRALGLFSPLKLHHPDRWGPRGTHVRVLLPLAPGTLPEGQIMKGISVEAVLSSLRDMGVIND